MRAFRKRSVWVMITVYVALWLAATLVGGVILNGFRKTINTTLGLSGYRTETLSNENEDLEYFKSQFVQKNEDGSVKYVIDEETGYKHLVYDDKALYEAGLQKARQVQREGTTILWNSASNGLPLEKGDKVSLFSHSSVAWVHSGTGSGNARTSGASNMKKALTNAGLSVNGTLWDFYSTGEGSTYTRTNRYLVNEVPWSKYTDTVKSSFNTYSDAAIITLSRRTGEGAGGGDGYTTGADTPSGDYFDLSSQERKMIEEVIALKKAGTFKKVIVLLNTATDLWLDPLLDVKNDIDCCMWVGQTGFNGLDEVGSILVGDSIPSGHLVDTFLQNTRANPAFINAIAKTYSNAHDIGLREVAKQGLYITYAEGIYLGYKYFETRYEDAVLNQGNATSKAGAVNSEGDWKYSEEVAFPFGYGGSYTTFEYSNFKIVENTDGDFEVTLTVKNAGSKKGADAVQIYSQKPYTEYDKQHGVEEAAVNLVGYAKTAELEAGATQDVKVIVRGDVFKTYDANNAKTYIREKGTYYLTAAQDAHDAVNNILAAKGKTPANTNGVMDAAGNSSLVKAYEFTDDDFTTYAISETGVEITNQFDDTDWNKYENKTEGTLVYLSRKDWAATYPTETIQLSLNDKMVYDLSWDKEVVENPEDEMPLYEQTHVFNLIDLKGLDYDHSAWDTLLDQLSLQDQITLLGTAYHGTEAIAHIAKPAEVTKDGPLGVRQKYKTNSTGYTLSYPSTTLLAASYNDKLALEVGTLMGEDMLHAGITGIYAPGANIHRMTYSGRNYEYYSEDGFMSGMMCKWQVVGIQAAGCYVNVKHIALNDQESNRYGVNIWVNEQAIREVYLPAFEYAVTEGDCTGLMASFTRFGVLWSGAHKGLMTNVLRGEWGFDGFVISDCSWYPFMGVVDGVMAGTDCILDTADLTAYYAAETNATVAQGIRESTHRILYVVVNSNAMNGYSANTRIYEVKEWWQHLVTGVQIGVATVTGILAIITALTFIFHGKIEAAAAAQDVVIMERKTKKRAMVQEKYGITYEDDFFGDVKHFYCVGQPWHLERILKTVISCLLAAVIVATAILVPVLVGKNTPANPNTGDNGGVVTPGGEGEGGGNENDNTGGEGGEEGEANKYIFEAEVAVLEFVPKKEGKLLTQCGLEGGTKATRFNPSGDAFMYNLEHAKTATLTYYVTAAEDTTATLSYCVGLNQACTADQLFNVTVNGTAATYSTPVAEIPLWSDVTTNSSERYYAWYEKDVMVINLKKGENTIVLEKSTYGLNFDYMALTTEKVTLQDTREAKNGHAYNDWTLISEPTLDKAGKISCYCATCREYVTEELPIISEANGYTKKVVTAGTDTTFGINEWTYVKGNTTFTFTRTESPANAKTFKFEAESMVLGGSAIRGQDIVYGASGNAYVGEFNNKTASVTLNVTADKDCQALLIINFGCRTNATITMNDGRTLTVNDEVVAIADTVKFAQVESSYNWYNWREYEVVVINLKAGKNVITLENAGKAFGNIDYFKLVSTGELAAWYEE